MRLRAAIIVSLMVAALCIPASSYAWTVHENQSGDALIERSSGDGTAAVNFNLYYRDNYPTNDMIKTGESFNVANWSLVSTPTAIRMGSSASGAVWQMTSHPYWLFVNGTTSESFMLHNEGYTPQRVYWTTGISTVTVAYGSTPTVNVGTMPTVTASFNASSSTLTVNPWKTMVDGGSGESILAFMGLLGGIGAAFVFTKELELRRKNDA